MATIKATWRMRQRLVNQSCPNAFVVEAKRRWPWDWFEDPWTNSQLQKHFAVMQSLPGRKAANHQGRLVNKRSKIASKRRHQNRYNWSLEIYARKTMLNLPPPANWIYYFHVFFCLSLLVGGFYALVQLDFPVHDFHVNSCPFISRGLGQQTLYPSLPLSHNHPTHTISAHTLDPSLSASPETSTALLKSTREHPVGKNPIWRSLNCETHNYRKKGPRAVVLISMLCDPVPIGHSFFGKGGAKRLISDAWSSDFILTRTDLFMSKHHVSKCPSKRTMSSSCPSCGRSDCSMDRAAPWRYDRRCCAVCRLAFSDSGVDSSEDPTSADILPKDRARGWTPANE